MWLLWWCFAHAEIVDRVVAVVDGEPILASDLHLDESLREIDPSPVPFWRASADPLDTAVSVVLIRHLAADVALYAPAREAVSERVAALRGAFASHDLWQQFLTVHGLDEQDKIEAVVRRRLVVERYLLRNVQASPDNADAWLAETSAMLEQLRRRPLRIREVPLRGAP
jgi:hypothetical protein